MLSLLKDIDVEILKFTNMESRLTISSALWLVSYILLFPQITKP